MTELRQEPYTLPGVPLGEENPLPFFRDPATDREIRVDASLPGEKRAYIGWETGFRILPYRMQDQYTRQRKRLTFQAVALENEYMKATFLPQVGGRLVSLLYKPLQRELLHRNPVFQPANLAIRNAWFSGGVEWNIGQYGHTFTTCSPIFAAVIRGAQGEPGLRLYEFERCKGLFWQIDFYLPPGLPYLLAYTRVINPNLQPASMYWWTNTAVDERLGVRVLAPTGQAIYMLARKDGRGFGYTILPNLPSIDGADGTYSLNFPFANEFFFQCDEIEMPWEAALDQEGSGFIEASTRRLKYRKLFCWGTHAGGRHWQEFLARPGEAYLEIQAGLAPTQVHGLPMPAHTAWDWTQAFGYVEADPQQVHGAGWAAAVQAVDQELQHGAHPLPQAELYRREQECRTLADAAPLEILQRGSGWGALELERRRAVPGADSLPAACAFPYETLGPEQHKWLALLQKGLLPEQDPAALPGEWLVQAEWEQLLEQSLSNPEGRHWYALLHLGVMRLEHFDEAGAEAAWLESLQLKPSAWVCRNLAILCLRRGQNAAAQAYYEQAWSLAEQASHPPIGLAVEYLQKLLETGQFERGAQIYRALPAGVQDNDRVQILRGQFALALNDLDSVAQVLEREYAIVREGEPTLTDLWFELHARQHAVRTGQPLDEALRRQVQALYPPPRRIDFRSHND